MFIFTNIVYSTEGTKPVLEERINEYLDNHPELEADPIFGRLSQFRKKSSPKKSAPIPVSPVKQSTSKASSTPAKLFQIAKRFRGVDSSPSKETQKEAEEESDEESDDDDEEDEDSDDDDVEVLEGDDKELLEEDSEYVPSKFGFVTTAQDWFIGKYENSVSCFESKAESLTSSVVRQSNSLRKLLSSADAINILTTCAEFGSLAKEQIPIIQLRQASFLDHKILSKYSKIINPKWPIVDISALLNMEILLVFLSWFLLQVAAPYIGAYYINFISKKSKKAKIDPFVFNIVKLIFAYLFLSGNVSFNDVKNSTEVWAEEHGLTQNTSYCHILGAYIFRNSITLRLLLGNLPFIDGAIGAAVALYAAAI